MTKKDIVILGGARTAMAEYSGTPGVGKLKDLSALELRAQAPYVLRGAREGFRFGQQPVLEDSLFASLMDSYCGFYMAQTAENLAKKHNIPRAAQDEFALRSHKLGAEAVEKGLFAQEIVPI